MRLYSERSAFPPRALQHLAGYLRTRLVFSIAERTRAIVTAGCDMVLHCNGKMDEMRQAAAETPVLSGAALGRADRALASRKAPQPFDRVAARKALDELIGRAGVVSV